MKFSIHTLQIGKGDFLLQDHLVETDDKVRVQESTMENGETQATTDELEVVEMFWVDTTGRVDLERVVVVGGVLEETVEGIEHFVRE
jgi:hypothetical protein